MALALVWEEDSDDQQVVLGLDTGTSPLYRVLLGTESGGLAAGRGPGPDARLAEVYWASPWQRNPAAGRHLRTTTRYRLDGRSVTRPHSLLQLHSAQDESGRASAFSRPLRLSRLSGASQGFLDGSRPAGEPAMTSALSRPGPAPAPALDQSTTPALRPVRNVPVRSAQETYSRPASLDDLLGAAIRAALPLVQQLLASPAPGAGTGNGTGTGTGATVGTATGTGAGGVGTVGGVGTAGAESAVAAVLASLLRAALGAGGGDLLGSLSGGLSGGLSDGLSGGPRVHVLSSARVAAARPMIAGVDDALIAMLAGAALDKLPELVNAIGQARENERGRQHELMRDALGTTERLRLLQALEGIAPSGTGVPGTVDPSTGAPGAPGATAGAAPAGAAPAGAAPAGASTAHGELLALLRTLLADGATVPAPAGPPVGAGTVAPPVTAAAPLSTPQGGGMAAPGGAVVVTSRPSRAVLLPVLAAIPGAPAGAPAEFAAAQAVTLRFRLEAGPGGPTVPLPRSILRLALHEPGSHAVLTVVEQRVEDLAPGAEIRVPVPAAEVGALPRDVPLEVRSALRWPGTDHAYRAGASTLLILRGPRAVTATGPVVGGPVELTDMARFRPFWNRVWSFDPAERWGLDAALRYTVLLVGADRGNALMATRSALGDSQPGARRDHEGRLKGGLEVSVHELNRLLPLWPGHTELPPEQLAPFTAPSWLATRGGDTVVPVRFEGSRATRGLLWAVPVPTLRRFEVSSPAEVDPFGQVLSRTAHTTELPVIESVRLLGLESTDAGAAPERTESGFAFEGFRVRFETVAGLEPAAQEARDG